MYSYCSNYSKNLILGGYEDKDYMYTASINVMKCSNDTSITPCKSDSDIHDFFIDLGITIYIEDRTFNPNDLESPIKNTFSIKKILLDPDYAKHKTINIKKVDFIDDQSNFLI